MKISVNWLKEFVNIARTPSQLKADLTMIGLNTESATQVGDDWVLDVEVTTNRPDCLNHYGVAREIATHYGLPLKQLTVAVKESAFPVQEAVSIEITDPDLCARYCGRVVRNVSVGPSPAWLVKRLSSVGQRSINNVADITNYVLMELGQPLHAFDLARLQQHRIIVRRAKPGEPLRTLDGVDHTLTGDNLVIADGARAVALAGVMGGQESEISASTRSVLLESAWFEPVSIRRTSKSQGFHTEASHRFERGADIEMAPLALDRAAALIGEIAGGEIVQGMIDVYPQPPSRPDITLEQNEFSRVLGTDISAEEIERILRGLGFGVEQVNGKSWQVSVPSFRVDVSRQVDLVEEVARHAGYDRLPARVRPAPPCVARDETRDKVIATSALLVSLGFREIIASSMVDPTESERFSASAPVILANPLSQDASAMRTSAVPSMLRAIRWNLDRGTNDFKLFELGKTYNLGPGGVPQEHEVLTLGATGNRRPASVYDSEAAFDFFDLKGDLETILREFDVPALKFEPSEVSYLHMNQSARIRSRVSELAILGLIGQEVGREYKLRQAAWIAEINFERLLNLPLRLRKFHPISKFPAVERDLSLVVPDDVPYGRLSSAIAGVAMEELRSFRPMDRFRGGGIPAKHYSLLVRLAFQSDTRTLTSDEVGALSQRLLAVLRGLGAQLRR